MTRASLSSRAFTLVELLVAAVMMTFLVLATTISLSSAARSRAASVAFADASARASIALQRIADDVRQSVRDHDLFYATIRIVPDETADELLLITRSTEVIRNGSGLPEGDEREVHYRLEKDAERDDETRDLWRRADAVPDEVLDGGGVATLVTRGIVKLEVEAYDGAEEEWTSAWDTDYDGYPHAIRVLVEATDDRGQRSAVRRAVIALDRTPLPPERLLDDLEIEEADDDDESGDPR